MEHDIAPNKLTDRQLAQVVEATIGVLGSQEGAENIMEEVVGMPPRVLRQQLEEAVAAGGFTSDAATRVAEAVTRSDAAPQLARVVLSELQVDNVLADEIADSYQRRRELMAVDPVTIAVGVLLLLVLRLNRVRVSKEHGVEVELEPFKGNIIQAVLDFLPGVR